MVSIPDRDGETASLEISRLLGERLTEGELESLSKNDQATVFSYAFNALPHDALLQLSEEVRRNSAGSTVNIFFNRAGV